MTSHITLPIVAAGYESAKWAVNFQQQMRLVSTQAGASSAEVNKMSAAILKLAPSTEQGPVELAKGLFHIESVGLRSASAMNALKAASEGAAVGQADLEQVATAMAGAWKTGIAGATTFGSSVATVNAIVGTGNMRMNDLVAAIGTGTLSTFKAAGLTFRDFGTGLAQLADMAYPATRAATGMRQAILMMAGPTKAATKELASLGLGQLTLAYDLRRPDGLVGALTALHDHMVAHGLDATHQLAALRTLFGVRSGAAIMSLMSNLDTLQGKYVQIGKLQGSFGASVVAQSKTMQAQIDRAKSSLETSGILVGNDLMPMLAEVAKDVASLTRDFDKLSPATRKFLVELSIGLAAGGPVMRGLGGMATLLGKTWSFAGRLGLRFGAGAAASGAGAALAGGGVTGAGAGVAGGIMAGAAGTIASAAALALAVVGPALLGHILDSKKDELAQAAYAATNNAASPLSTKGGGQAYLLTEEAARKRAQAAAAAAAAQTAAAVRANAGAYTHATGALVTKIQGGGNVHELLTQINILHRLAAHPMILGPINAKHSILDLVAIRDRLAKELHGNVAEANKIMADMFKDWNPKKELSPGVKAMEKEMARIRKEIGSFGYGWGTDLDNGFAQGILNKNPYVLSVAAALINDVNLQTARQLQAHSASRVYWTYGQNIDEGLIGGIQSKSPDVLNAMALLLGKTEAYWKKINAIMGQARIATANLSTKWASGGGGSSSGIPSAPSGGGGNVGLGQRMAAAYGWTGSEWNALYKLWMGESSWKNILNTSRPGNTPYNAAYGIPQADPGSKMASFGADWLTNPATQIAWGLNYIKHGSSHFHDPISALNFWNSQSPHWYGHGADFVTRRPQLIGVGDTTERVQITPLGQSRSRGGNVINIIVQIPQGIVIGSAEEVGKAIAPYVSEAQAKAELFDSYGVF